MPPLPTSPTEALRSSATTNKLSVSGDIEIESDYTNRDGQEVGNDRRIEEWLEQQSVNLSREGYLTPLRRKESSQTLVTTRTTSMSFSFESDPPFPSPTSVSSVTGHKLPSPSNQHLQPPPKLCSMVPRPQSDDPEVALADSPLLGFKNLVGNEFTADATHTCSLAVNSDGEDKYSVMDLDKVRSISFY